MDIEQLKQDVEAGRIELERRVELNRMLQREIDRLKKQIEELKAKRGGSLTENVDQSFSVKGEGKRQADRGKTPRKKN